MLHYRADGTWVDHFCRSRGFVDTLLLKALSPADCYLTIVRWRSALAYEDFRRDIASDYTQLDHACEGLTLNELPWWVWRRGLWAAGVKIVDFRPHFA